MCGLTGFLAYGTACPNEAETLARRMADTLRHRGPDDAGVWMDEAAMFLSRSSQAGVVSAGLRATRPPRRHFSGVADGGGSAWQWRDVAMQIIHATATAPCTNLMGLATAPISANQDRVGTRLCLWRNAIAVIQYAPLTGMGPGSHSGFTQPFDGQEAHNTC